MPPLAPLPRPEDLPARARRLLEEIAAFYGGRAPNVFLALALDGRRLRAAWDYARGVLPDRHLSRKVKTMLGLAASVVARSPYGIHFHRRELLWLGCGEEGLLEVLSIVQLFEAITRVADLLLMPPEIENADMPQAGRAP